LFFLDKDIDDLLHTKVISSHIVYTEYYSVENYLFIHGNIARAAAAASSLEERELATAVGDPETWRRSRAEFWKEWVVFCALAQKYGISHQCTYRLGASIINNPLDDPPDAALVASLRGELQTRSGMAPKAFQKAYAAVSRLINSIYDRGQYDRVFKGNWYFRLLERTVERTAAGRSYSSHGISNRLQGAIASTVDFADNWGEYFRIPMRDSLGHIP
jgi:hypothetical protein